MPRMKFVFSLLLAVVLVGCANTPDHRYSRVEVGMAREQVVSLLGEPQRISYNGALAVMEYDLASMQAATVHPDHPARSTYYVIVGRQDGRVRSFGKN
jgi:hypothetical protein